MAMAGSLWLKRHAHNRGPLRKSTKVIAFSWSYSAPKWSPVVHHSILPIPDAADAIGAFVPFRRKLQVPTYVLYSAINSARVAQHRGMEYSVLFECV